MENYFNYFTEIEECFRRCRSAHTLANPRLLLSSLDWALIESWKEAGVPLEAVLTGIERTFQRWEKRGHRVRRVNGLGYCSQEVLRASEEVKTGQAQTQTGQNGKSEAAPYVPEEIRAFLFANAEAIAAASVRAEQGGDAILDKELRETAACVRHISERVGTASNQSLEDLERLLTAAEEKLVATFTRASSIELLARFRTEIELGIAPYRGKMAGAQIESLERQFLKKRLFEHYEIPRLSLFYL